MDEVTTITGLLNAWGPAGAVIGAAIAVALLVARRAWPAYRSWQTEERQAREQAEESRRIWQQKQADAFFAQLDKERDARDRLLGELAEKFKAEVAATRASYSAEMQRDRESNRELIQSIVEAYRLDQAETRTLVRDLMQLLHRLPAGAG